MLSVLSGFLAIWVVVAVGWACSRFRVFAPGTRDALAGVSYSIGSPALLFLLLARADLLVVFARDVLISLGVIALCAVIAWGIARAFRQGVAGTVMVVFLVVYTNAAALGLPIAGYVLGDMTLMAPILLTQAVLIQPAGLTVLDTLKAKAAGEHLSAAAVLSLPFRNPITLGVLAGLAVNLAGVGVPSLLVPSLELLGQLCIATILVAFGISLHEDGMPGRTPHAPLMWTIVAAKMVLMPVVAWGLSTIGGFDAHTILAVTVIGALPSAQICFTIALRHGYSIALVRDTIFVDTLLSIPVLLAIVALLGV